MTKIKLSCAALKLNPVIGGCFSKGAVSEDFADCGFMNVSYGKKLYPENELQK
jgi:hypothetical protein